MKKKTILLLCFLLVLNLCCASAAFADSEKTMYAKQQTWIYSSGYRTAKYAVCPIGKGQQVKVGSKVSATLPDGRKDYFYQTSYFGRTFYIPTDKLTSKPPKTAYTIKRSFKELKITKKLDLYAAPSLSAAKEGFKETIVYTIGETRNWYGAFVDGKVRFISKKAAAIKSVERPTYVPMHIGSGYFSAAQKHIRDRVYLQYALLPEYMRNGLAARNTEIHIVKKLEEPFESGGNGGCTTSSSVKAIIYTKETNVLYNLEYALLHEIGHALSRYLWLGESMNQFAYLMKENITLQLGSYYENNAAEWIAECIAVLIKDPDRLYLKAPITYQFLMENVFGCRENIPGTGIV